MVHEMPKKRKRQFSQNIKVHETKRIQPPEDQSFADGVSIEMDTFDFNIKSGQRDRKVGHIVARFPCTETGLANLDDFYQQNRRIHLKKRKPEDEKQKSKTKRSGSKTSGAGKPNGNATVIPVGQPVGTSEERKD